MNEKGRIPGRLSRSCRKTSEKEKRRKNENIEFMLFLYCSLPFNSCTWNFYFVSCPESRSEGK